MVEPSFVANGTRGSGSLRSIEKGVQRGRDPRGCLSASDPTMVYGNADGCEPKSHGCDAASGTDGTTIRDEAIRRIGPIPKVSETRPLNVIQEFVIVCK